MRQLFLVSLVVKKIKQNHDAKWNNDPVFTLVYTS